MAVYNNPALGQSFENVAAMFAPPSASDLAGYSTAALNRQKKDQLAQLFGAGKDASEQAALTGVQGYGQTPTGYKYGVDQNNATSIATNAADNARAVQTNTLDNQTKLALPRFSPLAPGEALPAVQGSLASQFGLPADLGPVSGPAKPMSLNEVEGQQLLRLIGENDITDQMQVEKFNGADAPVKVVGADGKPTYASPGAALGQTAYVDAGSEAKGELYNYITADGTMEGTALFDGKTLVDQSTGAPLPQGVKIYKASAQGTTDQIGMGTNSNRTDAQRLRASVANANTLVNELEKVVVENPAATGLAGDAMSFLQDSGQVLKELTSTFGDGPISAEDMAAVTGKIDEVTGGKYNPAYRQARAMILELAYANASMNNPSGEVSMQALSREVDALGQGMMGNDQGLLGVLDVARSRMRRKLGQADVLDGTSPSLTPDQIGDGAPAAATGEAPPDWTPEEWGVLSDEEKAQVLNGQ